MAFTAEQKRARRLQKKQQEQQQNIQWAKSLMVLSPPEKELKTPYSKASLQNTNVDYGGHQRALNFTMPDGVNELKFAITGPVECMSSAMADLSLSSAEAVVSTSVADLSITKAPQKAKVGSFTYGLVYEGDWKAKSTIAGNGKRKRCLKSEEYLSFLLHCKSMLSPLVDETLNLLMDDSLRINCIRGARTLAHTDSHKGNAPNFVFIVKELGVEPGWLCYDTFPVFKTSVVKLGGKLCIPHGYSEASNELKMIGADPRDETKPIYYVFSSSALDSIEPYGNLDFGVIGWKANGYLQIVPEHEGNCLCTSPLVFGELTWNEIIADASKQKNRVNKKPWKRIVHLDRVNVWQEFQAYCYRHWWVGNPGTLRYHAFFRTIRQCPTSSNINRKGKNKINYIDATSGNWKIYNRHSESWCDIQN